MKNLFEPLPQVTFALALYTLLIRRRSLFCPSWTDDSGSLFLSHKVDGARWPEIAVVHQSVTSQAEKVRQARLLLNFDHV